MEPTPAQAAEGGFSSRVAPGRLLALIGGVLSAVEQRNASLAILPLPGGEVGGYHFEPMKPRFGSFLAWRSLDALKPFCCRATWNEPDLGPNHRSWRNAKTWDTGKEPRLIHLR